jgi:hypothetical protein
MGGTTSVDTLYAISPQEMKKEIALVATSNPGYAKFLQDLLTWQNQALETWSTTKLEERINHYEQVSKELQMGDVAKLPKKSGISTYIEIEPFIEHPPQQTIFGQEVPFDQPNVVVLRRYGDSYVPLKQRGVAMLRLRALWWVRNTRRAIALTGGIPKVHRPAPLAETQFETQRAIGKYPLSGGSTGQVSRDLSRMIMEMIPEELSERKPRKEEKKGHSCVRKRKR